MLWAPVYGKLQRSPKCPEHLLLASIDEFGLHTSIFVQLKSNIILSNVVVYIFFSIIAKPYTTPIEPYITQRVFQVRSLRIATVVRV